MQALCKLFLLEVLLSVYADAFFGSKIQKSLKVPLQNLEFSDGKLYIGGRNIISVFDKDLRSLNDSKTCSEKSDKDNDNQVLIVYKNSLVICGTGNDGLCEVRNTTDFSNVTLTSELKVSTDFKRPAVGIVDSAGNLIVGVTYGKGLELELKSYYMYYSYEYAISARRMDSPFSLIGSGSPATYKYLYIYSKLNVDASEYLIYYKSTFQNKGFIYFLTNQLEYIGGKNYVSKLVRVCQNDSQYETYGDIVLECQDKRTRDTFNLLQKAIILDLPHGNNEKILVATFTKGNDPENPSGDSVTCTEKLSVLDDWVVADKIQFAVNCNREADKSKRYVPYDTKSCVRNVTDLRIDDFLCKKFEPTDYAVGNKTHVLNSTHRLPSAKGYTSFLNGANLKTGYIALASGTSKGNIFRMIVTRNGEIFESDNFTVDAGFPIRGIYQSSEDDGDQELYVLSSDKIFKFYNYDCSGYKTCEQTVTGKDPFCGWCVFKSYSTRKENCSSSWLSSLESCVSLALNFSAIPIGTTNNVRIKTLSDQSLEFRGTYTYKCRFGNISTTNNTFEAKKVGNDFECQVPSVKVHTESLLELLVDTGTGEDIVLASKQFLFFNCSHFKKCGDCVKDRSNGVNCNWCLEAAKCFSSCLNENLQKDKCPQLQNLSGQLFAHSGITTNLSLTVKNIVPNIMNFNYSCEINDGMLRNFSGSPVSNSILLVAFPVTLQMPVNTKKIKYPIKIFYGDDAELDDIYGNYVTVYSCGHLASPCENCHSTCDFCQALITNYSCGWTNVGADAKCSFTNQKNDSVQCPPPLVTKISPLNGHRSGGTKLTIYGKEFGFNKNNIAVKIGRLDCENNSAQFFRGEDFARDIINETVCITPGQQYPDNAVVVTVNSQKSNDNITFEYKEPEIKNVTPGSGPLAGGTRITFTGDNLGIGNRIISNLGVAFPCADLEVFPKRQIGSSNNFWIECVSPSWKSGLLNKTFSIQLDDKKVEPQVSFLYTINPRITSISPKKAFLSGGTIISLQGQNMTNAHASEITMEYAEENKTQTCTILSPTLTSCKVPEASAKLKDDFADLENDRARRKRDTNSASLDVKVYVNLDGVKDNFTVSYFRDPEIDPFAEEVLVYGTDKQDLVIKGRYLNLVATKYDVRVTIGLEECSVVELTEFNIRCLAPKSQPASGEKSHLPEVNVTIGNIKVRVGYLEYEKKLETAYIIGGAVAGGLLFIIVMVVVIGIYKYRKVGEKARDYQKNLSDMEMEIRRVAREEFLDMHTTMSSVNRNLVEQGFPYHSYQQYACNVMFSVDYLWTEPVVSNGKMTDDERIKANKGMELMESLIYNKFFIVSVISTMEKQKRFFIREKANLAGNLCAVLMGKMDYLEEILKMLLSNLVQETQSKKQKSLFRRCESITEKLLSNWLSLCLYPHIRANSGSPLYLLYIATQKTMESGPIDAILGDAKYTLFEEKLLKKWSSAEEGTQDLKFEAKTLTLNVVVDNGDTIFKCKVLDCDTISQVKSKCMAQIYVNYPASQLNVDPQDLDLEWHEGFGGALRLKDEDNTSKHDGPWVRLNTLAHYNVKDESNMALVDPHGAENREEDYVNLTNVNVDNACNASVDSTEPLHPRDMQNPGALQHWHLVRKEEETSKQGKSAIAELYLNRLFTTKQCLMEYISTLFNIVLEKDRCPPPTKCLFDFLDDLGDRHKIDADTLYTWKSHSYAIRVWASLIKMPSLLFDVNIPNYVEENLDVISQVFIESFSLSSQKFTKDSPSQKLIFHNEMNQYRDKVKEFYKNVKVDSQAQDEYRQYMTEVNKQQQQTNFNKVSALYRLYKQLKPYFEEILEDLTTCKETSNLRLNKKLEEVMEIMEDEEK